MLRDAKKGHILTYCPLPYYGVGPAQTCVSLLENIPNDAFHKVLILPRSDRPISDSIEVNETFPSLLRGLPTRLIQKLNGHRLISKMDAHSLNEHFKRAIRDADSSSTIAYFWPTPPTSLVKYARDRGLLTIREMINTFIGTARIILNEAYDRLGLEVDHNCTLERAEREREELAMYDYVFAPSPMVEASLIEAGVKKVRILASSYGWSPSRFTDLHSETKWTGFRALFVGSVDVRKGIPQLLSAWKKCRVKGELVLAGGVDDAVEPYLRPYTNDTSVRLLGWVPDVRALYRSADIFIFPTFEEGNPLVIYEAAACGLPIITTPMGAGTLIRDGVNGLVVKSGDTDGLSDAILRLATSDALRDRFSRQVRIDAQQYTYQRVGADRANKLSEILANHTRR